MSGTSSRRRNGRPLERNTPLNRARIARGITIIQLGQFFGVSRGTSWRWCAGTLLPSPERRARISQLVAVPERELWWGDPFVPFHGADYLEDESGDRP